MGKIFAWKKKNIGRKKKTAQSAHCFKRNKRRQNVPFRKKLKENFEPDLGNKGHYQITTFAIDCLKKGNLS
ncbi:MAG: hypothetical protein GC192_13080 [Bacteroidetes bacterium]|nr:hypothetical protein [Bacteroidota bacterium]